MIAIGAVAAAGFAASPAAAQDIGYRGFTFDDANNVQIPTADKPQSKLWHNDGSWWGLLYRPGAGATRIHRLDLATQIWTDTGTSVDARPTARADVLWDAGKLYVLSGTTVNSEWGIPPDAADVAAGSAQLSRFSYNPLTKTYALDAGFPVTTHTGSTESVTLARDSTGQLWETFTRDSKVWVNRSLASDSQWGTPFVLPVPGTDVHYDDVSAIVDLSDAEGPKVGVLWSNQNTAHKRFYWSAHKDSDADGVWKASVSAYGGGGGGCSGGCGNDHLSLKQLNSDGSGRVFAAIKTAKQQPTQPFVALAVRERGGGWKSYTYGTVADQHTRPLVMIDEEHRTLYMFAVTPEVGGTIYYKKTPLDNIAFPPGLGTLFMRSSTDGDISNPTSTKQNVNGDTGIVVLASANSNGFYWHNRIDLSGEPVAPPATPTNLSVSTPATNPGSALNLAWSDNSLNETSVKIERRTGAGAFSQVAQVGANATGYTDTGLAPGTTYSYRVRATNASGDSGYSDEASGTTAQTGLVRTFAPVADTYVDNAVPASNFGMAASLKVDASPINESYLMFQVSGLAGSTVASAKLRFYVENGSTNGGTLHTMANTSWQESTVTYNARPTIDGPAITTLGSVNTTGQWYEFDVTAAVTGDGTISLGHRAIGSDGLHYGSRQSANPPQLIVTLAG